MRRSVLTIGLAAAALGLTACEEGAARRDRTAAAGGDGLCKPFSDNRAAAPGMMMSGAMVVEDCVHRWGYTLAKSEDDAATVAQAVVAACSAPLARWNQQTLGAAAGGGDRDGLQEAPSLLTGEPTNPILEHNNFAEGRALFYVVQARAGDCDPPRARDNDDDDRDQAASAAPGAGAPAYAPNSPDR